MTIAIPKISNSDILSHFSYLIPSNTRDFYAVAFRLPASVFFVLTATPIPAVRRAAKTMYQFPGTSHLRKKR